MPAFDFLVRLSLDQSADERAIKRAYARELKLIDQEANAAGFQVLREAYEMALHWLRHKPEPVSFAPATVVPVTSPVNTPLQSSHTTGQDASARPAPAGPMAPPRDAFIPVDAQALAAAEFDEFVGLCADFAAMGDERDPAQWRKQLQRSNNGERLLNITARAHFEYMIARLLADGWRPGHEGLFAAARQVFGWDRDSRRLLEFGQLGGRINQTIEESELFSHQSSDDCNGQTDALIRVRDGAKPKKRELVVHAPHLRKMVARMPAWTSIIASADQIEQWIALEQALPAWHRRFYGLGRPAASGGGGSQGWKVVLFFLVISAVFRMFDSSSDSGTRPRYDSPGFVQPSTQPTAQEMDAEAAYKRAAGRFYMPPGTRKLDPATMAEPSVLRQMQAAGPKRRFLNDGEMKAIFDRVDYKAQLTEAGTFKAQFNVELDEHGAIRSLKTKAPSGLPELDRKVEKAIRASAPFGPQIQRSLVLVLTARFGEGKPKAAAPAPAPAPEADPGPAEAEPPE